MAASSSSLAKALEGHAAPGSLAKILEREPASACVLATIAPDGSPLLSHWWGFHLQAAKEGLDLTSESDPGPIAPKEVNRLGWQMLAQAGVDPFQVPLGDPTPGASPSLGMALVDSFLDADQPQLVERLESLAVRPLSTEDLAIRDPFFCSFTPQPYFLKRDNPEGRLHHAARNDLMSTARWVLGRGLDPNQVDEKGRTPLFFVKSAEMLSLLAEAGAELDKKDQWGQTPMRAWGKKRKMGEMVSRAASDFPEAVSDEDLLHGVKLVLKYDSPLPIEPSGPLLKRLQPLLTRPNPSHGARATLMEVGILAAWITGLNETFENVALLRWLREHTPGRTQAHQWADLALVATDPTFNPSPAKLRAALSLLDSKPDDPLAPSFTSPLVKGLLRAMMRSLPVGTGSNPTPVQRRWLEEDSSGRSLVGRVFSLALEPLRYVTPRSVPEGWDRWLQGWAHHSSVLPDDSLAPALEIILEADLPAVPQKGGWAQGRTPAPEKEEGKKTDPDRGLSPGLACWVNRHVQVAQKKGQWPIEPELWEKALGKLADHPFWGEWVAMLEAVRIDMTLPKASASPSPMRRRF